MTALPQVNAHRNARLKVYEAHDPTRTTTLRARYAREMRKRFRDIRGIINDAIINKDVFGLADQPLNLVANIQAPVSPQQFNFTRSQDKVTAFMEWLQLQVDRNILETQNRRRIGSAVNSAWQNVFVEDSYKRGVMRANYELRKAAYPDISSIDDQGGISAVMGQPFHVDRLGLLYTRSFNELKGITDAMDQQISRVLAQGLGDGDNPRLLARKLNAVIKRSGADLGMTDTLGRYITAERRAEILARTEVIRAHHSGMMQEYENWGVQGVEVQAEFRTAGDDRVCIECEGLEGTVYALSEARNLIPVHPMCRCIVLPIRPGDAARSTRSRTTAPPQDSTIGADLAGSPASDQKPLGGGVNVTEIVSFRSGRKGVFKPEDGERWGGIRLTILNEDFTLAQREVLASKIDEALGLNRVPKTVIRESGGRRGSIQHFVEDTKSFANHNYDDIYPNIPPDEMYRSAVFDTLIGNTDRHNMNILFKNNKPVLIDNGYSFPQKAGELRLQAYQNYARSKYPGGYGQWAAEVSDATRDQMVKALKELDIDDLVKDFPTMRDKEINTLKQRLRYLIEQIETRDFLQHKNIG